MTSRKPFSHQSRLAGWILLLGLPFWIIQVGNVTANSQLLQTPHEHPFYEIQALDVDPLFHQMWIGTSSHGAIRVDLTTGAYDTFTTANGLTENDIRAVTLDQPPYVWLGTHNSGLIRYDTIHHSWWTLTNATSSVLQTDRIHALTVDADGNLWASTDKGTAMFPFSGMVGGYLYYGWQDCNPAGPLCRGLWSYTVGDIAFAPDGDGWFAIDLFTIGISPKPGGMAQRDRENASVWNTWDMSQNLPTNQAWAVAVDSHGTVWAGTMEGLAHYDGNDSWTSYTQSNSPLATNQVEDIEFDADDNLWIATHQGVNQISASGEWSTLTDVNGLPSNNVNVLLTYDEYVCFGTDIGLGCLNQVSGIWQYYGDRNVVSVSFLPLLVNLSDD